MLIYFVQIRPELLKVQELYPYVCVRYKLNKEKMKEKNNNVSLNAIILSVLVWYPRTKSDSLAGHFEIMPIWISDENHTHTNPYKLSAKLIWSDGMRFFSWSAFSFII